VRVFDQAGGEEDAPVRQMRPGDPASPSLSVSPPRLLSRRQLLQAAAGLGALVVLGALPDVAEGASLPALTAAQLTAAMAGLPTSGSVRLPGGGHAEATDLRAAAAAFAVGDPDTPDPASNPVAALGVLCALAAWSGHSGTLDLSVALPRAPVKPLRLAISTLPGGASTDLLGSAIPPGLVVRPSSALILIGTLSSHRVLAAIEDPVRTVAGHPRLELVLLRTSDVASLLTALHAKLDSSGTVVLLASGSKVPLRPLASSLAARLLAGAGVRFVDAFTGQPASTTTPLLIPEPVVPAPDPAVVPSWSHVAPASDGRILALDSGGNPVGHAEYIGGVTSWNWLGKDGLGWTLREEADAIGWRVGCEIGGYLFNDPRWRSIFRAEFNQGTIDWGLYWGEAEPQRGQFDFSVIDQQVALAQVNGARIRGSCFVFGHSDGQPDWLLKGAFSPAELSEILRTHITTIMERYRGVIAEWVVVNEPYIAPYSTDDIFYTTIGPSYIEAAYETARAVDPGAVLTFSDTDNHTADGITTALTHDVVNELRAKKLIDKVALEMHIDAGSPPDPGDVTATMQSYGIPVCVSEFDIDLSRVTGTLDEKYALQAQIAASMLKAARASGVCRDLTRWGLGDGVGDKWLQRPGAPAPMASPYDGNLQPKPFFTALLQGMAASS
jgi:endo-1,4-beta-xylanase